MNSLGHRLDLLFNTVRHLSQKQILYRLYYIGRKQWWKLTAQRSPLGEQKCFKDDRPLFAFLSDGAAPGPWTKEAAAACKRCEAYAVQQFRFLNVEVSYPEGIDWHDTNVSRLWRYQLHYFDYVQDLLVWGVTQSENRAWEVFTRLIDSWIEGNRRLQGDGWHPFTLSVRLVNWLHALCAWNERFKANPEFLKRFMESLDSQARILSSSLEHDVRGNHLLKNLRALLWAGMLIDDTQAKRWKSRALALLQEELAEQILPDGGHFERTPGYHAIVLKDILEMGLLLRHDPDAGKKYVWLNESLRRMLQYLCKILPPQGRLPLIKDTAWDASPNPYDLLAAGALYFQEPSFKRNRHFGLYPLLLFGKNGWETFRKWPVVTSGPSPDQACSPSEKDRISGEDLPKEAGFFAAWLPESGYCVLKDEIDGDHLIFDAGKTCPDYLPAHAHADLFSYELTVNHQRIVVDSGVFEYQAGKWRDYFRATRAHNTVEVGECNQSEVWGSFRVARRARPFKVSCKGQDNCVIVDARHDGYLRLQVPVVHRRILVWERRRFWVIIDQLSGTGTVSAANHIHLAPAIRPSQTKNHRWELEGMSFPLWIQSFQNHDSKTVQGQLEPCLQGWYSEQFGRKEPNNVLALNKRAPLPFIFGYMISLEEPLRLQFIQDGEESCIVKIADSRQFTKIMVYPDEVKVDK